MRKLVASGVVIYFQIEGIDTNQPDAELQVSLYSALAQADNASHREERAWGVTRRAQDGTSEMYKRACYGYVKTDDGVLAIDKETFRKVQEEKKRRSSYEESPDGKKRKDTKYSSKR